MWIKITNVHTGSLQRIVGNFISFHIRSYVNYHTPWLYGLAVLLGLGDRLRALRGLNDLERDLARDGLKDLVGLLLLLWDPWNVKMYLKY